MPQQTQSVTKEMVERLRKVLTELDFIAALDLATALDFIEQQPCTENRVYIHRGMKYWQWSAIRQAGKLIESEAVMVDNYGSSAFCATYDTQETADAAKERN